MKKIILAAIIVFGLLVCNAFGFDPHKGPSHGNHGGSHHKPPSHGHHYPHYKPSYSPHIYMVPRPYPYYLDPYPYYYPYYRPGLSFGIQIR